MIIIGIAGASGSGKSFIAEKIAEYYGRDNTLILNQDSYYHDISHLSQEERINTNYDHPDAFDNKLLYKHILALKQNQCIKIPIYDYQTSGRKNETIDLEPKPIVIVEGILVFYNKELSNLMDIRLFIDQPLEVSLARGLLRDINKRGIGCEFTLLKYENEIRPMYKEYIEPTKYFADYIFSEVVSSKSESKIIDFIQRSLFKLEEKRCETIINNSSSLVYEDRLNKPQICNIRDKDTTAAQVCALHGQASDGLDLTKYLASDQLVQTSSASKISSNWLLPSKLIAVFNQGYVLARSYLNSDSDTPFENLKNLSATNIASESNDSAKDFISESLKNTANSLLGIPVTTLAEHAENINANSYMGISPEYHSTYQYNRASTFSEKVVIGQYIAYFARKYSPFTLPWNKLHVLSDKEIEQLKSYQILIKQFERIIVDQKASRVKHKQQGLFDDKFNYCNKVLLNVTHMMTIALKYNQITDTQLSEIHSKISKVEVIIHTIAQHNRTLKKIALKADRKERRNKCTGKASIAIIHYNSIFEQLKQEIKELPEMALLLEEPVYTNYYQNDCTKKLTFARTQQFWRQLNSDRCQLISSEEKQVRTSTPYRLI
jgi:uridine kinase